MSFVVTFDQRPVPWSRSIKGDRTPRRLKQDKYIHDLAMIIKAEARGQKLEGPVFVRLVFDYERNETVLAVMRASKNNYRVKRPDIDNLCKMVLESLQKSGVLADDAQVCLLEAEKIEHSR